MVAVSDCNNLQPNTSNFFQSSAPVGYAMVVRLLEQQFAFLLVEDDELARRLQPLVDEQIVVE